MVRKSNFFQFNKTILSEDIRLLDSEIYWLNRFDKMGASITVTRRAAIERRIAAMKLVNQLFESSRFQIDEANGKLHMLHLVHTTMRYRNKTILIKLFDWNLVVGRHLRTKIVEELHPPCDKCESCNSFFNGKPVYVFKSLLQTCLKRQPEYSVSVFKKFLNFADMGDEVRVFNFLINSKFQLMQLNYPLQLNANHTAIYHNRVDVFKLFRTTTTETIFKARSYGQDVTTLAQYAIDNDRTEFIKIINFIDREWKSKMRTKGRGHVFYCIWRQLCIPLYSSRSNCVKVTIGSKNPE